MMERTCFDCSQIVYVVLSSSYLLTLPKSFPVFQIPLTAFKHDVVGVDVSRDDPGETNASTATAPSSSIDRKMVLNIVGVYIAFIQ